MQNLYNLYNLQNMYLVRTGVQHKFPWKDLDPDVQAQILQDAPQHARRYFTNPDGGFNWTELDRGIRAQIRQQLRDITRRQVVIDGHDFVDWPVPYNMRNDMHDGSLKMRWSLSFERVRESVLHTAPLLTVTFRHSLIRAEFAEAQAAQSEFHNGNNELSASELDSLCAQMDRTRRWRNVHTIRLIRWPGIDPSDDHFDRYSFEFVSTDEHGNEVTSTFDTLSIDARLEDDLWRRFANNRMGLRLNRVTLRTERRRRPDAFIRNGMRDAVFEDEISRTDATEWRCAA
jgi:hypothetical protein